MGKRNCWEILQCGAEPGGAQVSARGVCPAATDAELDRLNGGANGGRMCWAVSGTYCHGEIQGTAARKELTCRFCDAYRAIKEEEGQEFFTRVPGRTR
jgi:hypothetical protein